MDILTAQSTLISLKKELGKRNFAALCNSYKFTISGKKEALANVKSGKKITQKRFLELCDVYADVLNSYANDRFNKKRGRNYGKFSKNAKQNQRINNGNCGIEYAKQLRITIIKNALLNNATKTSGCISLSLNFTDNPLRVHYLSNTEKGEKYSNRCTWRHTDLNVSVTLPKNWLSRVYNKGFEKIDGLFNLDISRKLKVKNDANIDVYAAKWLVKSMGSSFNVVDGFIAKNENVSFHGKTLKSAINGLKRKLNIQKFNLLGKNTLLQLAKNSDKNVYLSDSYKVGNCKWGTLDFCARHNIDTTAKKPQIKLSKLAALAELEPRPEVLHLIKYKLAS